MNSKSISLPLELRFPIVEGIQKVLKASAVAVPPTKMEILSHSNAAVGLTVGGRGFGGSEGRQWFRNGFRDSGKMNQWKERVVEGIGAAISRRTWSAEEWRDFNSLSEGSW
jgi:hypothetical protein